VEQRWVLLHSAPRQPQAQRTVDTQRLTQSEHEGKAFKHLCRPGFACAADAPQALITCAQTLQATFLTTSTGRAQPRDSKRGRPSQDAQPDQVV
jgi:hypothetical protein